MAIVNGANIQNAIKERLKARGKEAGAGYRLAVVYVGNDPVIDRFVRTKEKFGQEIGVDVKVFRFDDTVKQDDLLREIARLGADEAYQGIIIQLPLPSHIDAQEVLDAVPVAKDVDVLSQAAIARYANGEPFFVPAVAGAVEEIFRAHGILLEGKTVVVVGRGRLVGMPVYHWLRRNGIDPIVIDEQTENSSEAFANADIIISGAGNPHMIVPDMIKGGSVLIDAGTSEQGGKLVGDIDPLCAEKAALFAPVPGGVGPITVAILFPNLLRSVRGPNE